jgi:uncharacterized protein (TIGR00255 family)
MLSMTGYGTSTAQVGSAAIVVEVRTLNHRFLDVRARMPPALADHAVVADDIVRRLLVRGRVELTARLDGVLPGQVVLDRDRAKAALLALQQLRDELGMTEPVPLSLLSAVPGLFSEQARDPEDMRAALHDAAQSACVALLAMRRNEGAALARDLGERIGRMNAICERVGERASGIADRYREKLRARILALLAGTSVALDPARLEHEVALAADRSDVSEELTRLESHCQQFLGLMERGDEPVGRQLEFLLQEMGREVNTLGSKVDDLELTAAMLELKAELERLREQVQNVL